MLRSISRLITVELKEEQLVQVTGGVTDDEKDLCTEADCDTEDSVDHPKTEVEI